MFFLSLKDGDDDPIRNSFDIYYMPLVEIKYFNALIDNKPFSDQPIKKEQEEYEKLVETSRNDWYTTENLFDYFYHEKYKPIATDSSRHTNTSIPQQFTAILMMMQQCFLSLKGSKKLP